MEPQLALPAADVRELSHLAGHYLLRGEKEQTLRAVLLQGLPPEGVRSPAGLVRDRLLRYLPPVPHWPRPAPAPALPAQPSAPHPKVSLVKPVRPDRRHSPAAIIQDGGSWRAALKATGL